MEERLVFCGYIRGKKFYSTAKEREGAKKLVDEVWQRQHHFYHLFSVNILYFQIIN